MEKTMETTIMGYIGYNFEILLSFAFWRERLQSNTLRRQEQSYHPTSRWTKGGAQMEKEVRGWNIGLRDCNVDRLFNPNPNITPITPIST